MSDVKNRLIAAGVRNLKEYGYPHVTPTNITTDPIYSQFFVSMLRDNRGRGADKEISELLQDCGEEP